MPTQRVLGGFYIAFSCKGFLPIWLTYWAALYGHQQGVLLDGQQQLQLQTKVLVALCRRKRTSTERRPYNAVSATQPFLRNGTSDSLSLYRNMFPLGDDRSGGFHKYLASDSFLLIEMNISFPFRRLSLVSPSSPTETRVRTMEDLGFDVAESHAMSFSTENVPPKTGFPKSKRKESRDLQRRRVRCKKRGKSSSPPSSPM